MQPCCQQKINTQAETTDETTDDTEEQPNKQPATATAIQIDVHITHCDYTE